MKNPIHYTVEPVELPEDTLEWLCEQVFAPIIKRRLEERG